MFNLKDKVAIVTGGRRGMGKAHALALSSRGANWKVWFDRGAGKGTIFYVKMPKSK